MMQQRMTKQKKLVLDVVRSHYDHPTADEIYLEVRGIDSKISRGTVYRNLEQLANNGLLLHVKMPGADRYDSRCELHYHMICNICNMIYDVPYEYEHQLDKIIKERTGFQVDRHRTIFEGICPDCMAKEKNNN